MLRFFLVLFLVFGCITPQTPIYTEQETIKLEFRNFEYQTLKFWNENNLHVQEFALDSCNVAERIDALTWQISFNPCS